MYARALCRNILKSSRLSVEGTAHLHDGLSRPGLDGEYSAVCHYEVLWINDTFMDMRYTYEKLWEAYQNLLRENAVLNLEILRLKSRNGKAGGLSGIAHSSKKNSLMSACLWRRR